MKGIVVIHKGKKVRKVVADVQVKEAISLIKQKYKGAEVLTYSLAPISPPRTFMARDRNLWCPYCAEIRLFELDPVFEVLRCPMCRISDREFYVKKYNSLYDDFVEALRADRRVKIRKVKKNGH